ncbi:MAG: SMC-Scp complex subunit ScpB [Filifactoraceae bacterium]
MVLSKMISIIESLLFVSGDPIKISEIIKIINKHNDRMVSKKEIDYCLNEIKKKMNNEYSGIKLITTDEVAWFVANDDNKKYMDEILMVLKKKSLTQASIEVLTIVAYNQPITKLEIEEIRGVKSDRAITSLIEFNLISEAGRLDKIGRPILYKTSNEFLIHFGLESLNDLPKLNDDIEL